MHTERLLLHAVCCYALQSWVHPWQDGTRRACGMNYCMCTECCSHLVQVPEAPGPCSACIPALCKHYGLSTGKTASEWMQVRAAEGDLRCTAVLMPLT